MLILPMVNKRRVMNAQIKLKNAEKIRTAVNYDDASESEIIVNREKFSESSFKDSRSVDAPLEFIRSRSLLYPRNFLVTTKEESDSSLYDVYELAQPPEKVNDSLDKLYSEAVTDLRKEIPRAKARGRYVSFGDLGFDEYLTDDKIASLKRIVEEERDTSLWPKLFKEAGVSDLSDTIDFINNFEWTILSDTSIPEESLQDTLRALSNINTRDSRNLNKYYERAKSNTEIYAKISYISMLLYKKPLTLMKSDSPKQNQLVKKMDEVEYKKAA